MGLIAWHKAGWNLKFNMVPDKKRIGGWTAGKWLQYTWKKCLWTIKWGWYHVKECFCFFFVVNHTFLPFVLVLENLQRQQLFMAKALWQQINKNTLIARLSTSVIRNTEKLLHLLQLWCDNSCTSTKVNGDLAKGLSTLISMLVWCKCGIVHLESCSSCIMQFELCNTALPGTAQQKL